MYKPGQVNYIVDSINAAYPREDGKLVCIHHAFVNHKDNESARAPYHFHLQIPLAWKNLNYIRDKTYERP
jgi:hypothetical protein